MLKIRKGDIVFVIAGKDKGKTGKVIRVFLNERRALVEGINRVKKAMRRTSQDQKGGLIELELPIHISNLEVFCKTCGKPARVGMKMQENLAVAKKAKSKVRFCKRCKEAV